MQTNNVENLGAIAYFILFVSLLGQLTYADIKCHVHPHKALHTSGPTRRGAVLASFDLTSQLFALKCRPAEVTISRRLIIVATIYHGWLGR